VNVALPFFELTFDREIFVSGAGDPGVRCMNRATAEFGLAAPGPVTVTSTVARSEPGGVVAVMVVGETTVNAAAGAPPKLTPVAPSRYCPLIVTEVPPAGGPVAGLTLEMMGASTTSALNWSMPSDPALPA
jgi:hypothetical protein